MDREAGAALEQRQPRRLGLDPDLPPGRIRCVGHSHGDREAVWPQPAEYAARVLVQKAHPLIPDRRPVSDPAMLGLRFLAVAGADLLDMRSMNRGALAQVTIRPDEDALWPHLDVDPRVVPVEERPDRFRRLHLLGPGHLLPGLAHVAVGVGLQIRVVDAGGALAQAPDAAPPPGPRRIGKEESD